MKFKARIKSMLVENINNSIIYKVCFTPSDRTVVCNEQYYKALDSVNVVEYPMKDYSFDIKKDVFDFLSQHSKDEFIIETNGNTSVISIELIYG